MPLKTFHNLPDDRKNEIIRTSIREFAHNDYESASLARIIDDLDIARGSFYRYFESKADVYVFLYEITLGLLNLDVDEYLRDSERDFYASWVDFSFAALDREREYPHYLEFLSRASSERRPELYGENAESKLMERLRVIRELVEFHQTTGQVRTDVDVTFLTLFLIHTRIAVRQYMAITYSAATEKGTEQDIYGIPENEVRKILNTYALLLRGALSPREEDT